jgi:hypothetical protein
VSIYGCSVIHHPLDLGHSPFIITTTVSREDALSVRFAVPSPAILCQRGIPRIHAISFSAGFLLKPLKRTACPVFPPSVLVHLRFLMRARLRAFVR